jgi:hypothetical protein
MRGDSQCLLDSASSSLIEIDIIPEALKWNWGICLFTSYKEKKNGALQEVFAWG